MRNPVKGVEYITLQELLWALSIIWTVIQITDYVRNKKK
jgi:hypothetical protein